jgi:hypothetical protein
LAATARPDFQVKSQDYTVVSGGSASFVVPADFFDVIDVVANPDVPGAEYSLGPFAWQNRRSPGGWLFPNTGSTVNANGYRARLMDSTMYIEPSQSAGGPYRLWYCPAPKKIRADITARLATTGPLPTYTPSGIGLGHTLFAVANGVLTVDGSAVVAGDIILVKDEVNNSNGVYVVNQPGTAGSPYLLTRSTIATTTGGFGTMVYVSSGATNVDLFYETTSTTITVDSAPWTWAEAFINPILEQFIALLEIDTAYPAATRDERIDVRPMMVERNGQDGQGGLVKQLKDYFRAVRVNQGPAKMVDTDQLGPRMWWGR